MVKFILLEEDHEMQYKIKKAIRAVSIKNDKDIKILNFPVWSLELNQEIKDDTCSKIYVADLRKKENKERLKIVEKIRKIDLESDIIFIINKDFIETVHQKIVQIFDVVDQPEEMEKRLEKDFEILLEKKSNPHILYLKKEKKSFEIPMKKILYITRDKKDRQAIIYYTLNETEKTKGEFIFLCGLISTIFLSLTPLIYL